ncbi:sulfatase [Pseudonocardia sp. GCM10023141]|uniref:sulfatase n=1 Tax=Pseudonocardia sp. GCM10023141 TaxID=3252653 RepID=UPI003616240C
MSLSTRLRRIGDGLRRPLPARVITGLAAVAVYVALIAPRELGQLTPAAFLRIPVEGLVAVAVLLVLPPRPRRVVAVIGGTVLGVLTILKAVDMGFLAALARPFDLVLDWPLLVSAVSVLADSIGPAGAIVAVIAAVVLTLAVVGLMALAALRLSRVVAGHRPAARRAVAVLAVAWLGFAALGAQLVTPVPIAARSAAALVYQKAAQVPASLRDEEEFAAQSAVDAFRDTPGPDLLGGLRGKDVVLSFVESYGRAALDDPEFAPHVDAVLDDGTRRLDAAGFASRSAFLTSPVAGGGSWLAQATFLSGLWIDNQQRYRSLVASDRLTLPAAFGRADWQTVAMVPGTTYAWPESRFYGFDRVYDAHTIGYRGPNFSWSTMPDQYVLSAFEHAEHAKPGRAPLLAEIPLTSSHVPWAPIPKMIDWNAVGDGSVFGPMPAAGIPPDTIWGDGPKVRTEYRRSIEYSLSSLISYVETYGDDDLVLVFLGDHQAAPIVTGEGAGRDVPITIVTRDRSVLDRVSGWGWQPGLRPGPQAPVTRMDTFRDRFLTAFAR